MTDNLPPLPEPEAMEHAKAAAEKYGSDWLPVRALVANIDLEHHVSISREPVWIATHDELERFTALVMEECAKVADEISNKYVSGYYGQEVDTADEIAAAIRARKPA